MSTLGNGAVAEWRNYWTLPLAGCLGYSTAVLHAYAIGSFIAPLQDEFGWSRAKISIGISIVGVAGAILSVPVGMLVDRIGPRVIGLTGVLLMTAAFALLGTATGGATNWFLLWGLVAFGNLGLQATVLISAIASRFENSRGLAFAITISGASLGASVFPVLATWLIGSYGWRLAFISLGSIWAVLVFPIVFLFFHGAQDKGRVDYPQLPVRSTLLGVSVADGLQSPSFYKLMMAGGLLTFTALGIIIHFVPILTDQSADPLVAAGIASLIGVFSIFGRLSTGVLLDCFPAHIVGASAFCLPMIACALLLFDGANPFSQGVAAACFGLAVGAEVDIIAYLASQHLGLKNYGVLFGAINSALALGVGLGPLAAAAAFDRYGSYAPFLVLTMVLMAAGVAALLSLPRPPFSTQNSLSLP